MAEKGQGKASRVTFAGREKGRGGKRKAVCGRQANEWLWGSEWGIRHVSQGLNFPSISMTPGYVLIAQDTSPNPLPVLLSVWSPLSSIQCCGKWTKARDEKEGPLFEA